MQRLHNHMLPLVLAALLTAITTWFHSIPKTDITFKAMLEAIPAVELAENEPLIFQLFYDRGEGYQEKHSVRFPLEPKKQMQVQQKIICPKIYGVRLDILNVAGLVTIKEAALYDTSGSQIYDLRTTTPELNNQIAALQRTNDGTLSIQTEAQAFDPYYLISFSPPLQNQEGIDISSTLLFGCKVFFMLWAGMWVTLWVVAFSERGSKDKKN